MIMRYVYLIISLLVLHGCVITPPITSTVHYSTDELYSLVNPGKTSRSELEQTLGTPIINNDHYRVDVYLVLMRSEVHLEGFLYYLLPDRIDFSAYGLVAYDESMVVKDITWGEIAGEKEDNFILEADDFYFESESYDKFMQQRKTVILFARKSDSQQSLYDEAPQGECILNIAPDAHVHKIILDDEELASIPLGKGYTDPVSVWFKGFIKILLPIGEHALSMTTFNYSDGPIEYKRIFSCNSGEQYYAYSNIESYKWTDKIFVWPSQYKFRGDLNISDTLPEVFEERRLILYYGDLYDD